MKSVYKYAIVKYAKSYSTWIITLISMLLVFMLAGVLPFAIFKQRNANDYAKLVVVIVSAITAFMSIITSIFSGFKAATMYKDEVEDGTFLSMLSKPHGRSSAIYARWLALQTIIVGYTFVVAITFLFAVVVFDNGNTMPNLKMIGVKTLRQSIVQTSLFIWLVLTIVAAIFSSLSLLVSTKLSVASTIGISVALGIVIPVTSLVGTFTAKSSYNSFSSNFANRLNNYAEIIPEIKQAIDETGDLTSKENQLYSLGVTTGEKDPFKLFQIFDLQYQIQTMSDFATDQVVKSDTANQMAADGGFNMKPVSAEKTSDSILSSQDAAKNFAELNSVIRSSWQKLEKIRLALLNYFADFVMTHKIDQVTFPYDHNKIVTINESNKALLFDKNVNFVPTTTDNGEEFYRCFKDSLKTFDEWNKEYEASNKLDENSEQIWFYYAYVFDMYLTVYIPKNSNFFPDISPEEKQKIMTVLELIDVINKPLTFWFDPRKVDDYAKSKDLDTSGRVPKEAYADLGIMSHYVKSIEHGTYLTLYKLISSGDELASVRNVNYANKWVVLWIYLALALGLVPVSYFVVRKQDFR